jgi:hypothetical protein
MKDGNMEKEIGNERLTTREGRNGEVIRTMKERREVGN